MAEKIALAEQIGAAARAADERAAKLSALVARQQVSAEEANRERLALQAAVETLRYVQRHEAAIKAAASA